MVTIVTGTAASYGKTVGPMNTKPSLNTVSNAGTIANSDKMVSIKNIGEADAAVAGDILPPGETVTWQSLHGIDPIEYDATGTSLLIARGV